MVQDCIFKAGKKAVVVEVQADDHMSVIVMLTATVKLGSD